MVRFFKWHGRMNRYTYFACTALEALAIIIIALVLGSMNNPVFFTGSFFVIGLLHYYLIACWSIQRLHDLNKPGWFSVFLIIPVIYSRNADFSTMAILDLIMVGTYFLSYIILQFVKGTKGPNPYGQDPLASSFELAEEMALQNEVE